MVPRSRRKRVRVGVGESGKVEVVGGRTRDMRMRMSDEVERRLGDAR